VSHFLFLKIHTIAPEEIRNGKIYKVVFNRITQEKVFKFFSFSSL
jgi:hypothetical protein